MEKSQPDIKLLIEGSRKEKEAPKVPERLLGVVKETRRLEAFEIRPAARGEGEALPAETIAARPDDVLELELEGGYRVWMSVDEYRRALTPPDQLRRGTEPESLPATVRVGADFPGTDRERGVVKWVVKGLKFIGIDVAAGAARFIAGKIDDKDGLNGLYSLALSGQRPSLMQLPIAPGAEPLLLFIHGTMSSTDGSFGGLWSDRQDLLGRLRQMYGERAYAFEHRTLGESPIENAIALAAALPQGAVLHLVSHSRGGMIGELLCRAQRCQPDGTEAAPPFEQADFDLFPATGQAGLRQLDAILAQKKFTIERFVRVACPARGTTLASGRMDRWLSVVWNGLSHLINVPWVGDIGWLITCVIKERTDPEVMPGIHAMMPDSATVALLNRPEVTVKADLRVIAGDYEGGGALGLLADWGVEQFFDSLNDLVVNTPSMYGGATRQRDKPGWYFYAEGPQAYHFNYFKDAATASRFADALALEDPVVAGFKPISEAPGKDDPIGRGIVIDFFAEGTGDRLLAGEPSLAGTKPLLVLVPGIMGTHLKVGDRIWAALGALVSGRFEKLAIDNREVGTDGMVKMAYGDLADFLAGSHEVLPFPYDWRLSLRTEGKRLAGFMDQVLKAAAKNDRPVRIVAHSMGGLLVRMAAVLSSAEGGTDWWPAFSSRLGSRLIMAGTPNGGSWMVPLALTGRADIIKTIATLDRRHNSADIVRIARGFEGFLEMLPVGEGGADPLAADIWKKWKVEGENWEPPGEAALQSAGMSQQLLGRFKFEAGKEIIRYLAGRADHTPTAPALSDGKLRFGSSPDGDGRVLWSTGIPWPEKDRQGRVWYLDAPHGDLLDTEPAFQGIREILETGNTTLLSSTPVGERGAARGIEENPWERATPFYPDQAMLLRSALGSSPGRERRATRGAAGVLRVSVCHGDLASARHPVAVGHYLGDAITGSEAALDRRLDCILSRRHRLGIYPGPDGTSEVFFNDAGDWGAIVIGLGQVGDLSAKKLSESFAKVLLEFATSSSKCVSKAGGFSISSILIGSGAGWGLGVRDSVRALIEGARLANSMLGEVDGGRTFLQELELIELYEDRALQALHAVRDLSLFGIFTGIDLQAVLRPGQGGRCRAMCDETGGWWRRMKVELKDDALKYTVITGLARTEETVLPTQRCLVESLIAEAIRGLGVEARDMAAIYNLLTPNALKERAPDQGDLLMMLDEGAAGYPWEMMQVGDPERREALALRAGLLRQLVLPGYRERVAYSVGTRALVVANPELPKGAPFPDLPGAQSEGEAVAAVLSDRGFIPERCIRSNPRQILGALFDGEYRILHLAGHGVHRFEKKRRREDCSFESRYVTGMVLDWKQGDGQGGAEPVLLTAAEVRQLRRVPELVFINCCFLGVPGPQESRRRTTLEEPSLFAASVAKEFISMGVRAVIAAGWAVNDSAAKAFASHFYGAMLDGSSFGEAVHGARLEAHKAVDSSNTWAAYQCYGDPDYRLRGNDGKEKARFFLSPREAICEIRGLVGAPKDASGLPMAPEKLRSQLAQIVSVLPHTWFTGNGELREAIGDVCADICDYQSAIEHYQAATCAGGGSSIRAVEQLFNMAVRHRENQVASGNLTAQQAETEILQQIDNFRDKALSVLGETPERCALIGSAYKRLLMSYVERDKRPAAHKVESWLAELKNWYQKGAVIQGEVDPYNALNWLTAEIVSLYRHPGNKKPETPLRGGIAKVLEKGQRLYAEDPNFWHGIYPLDAQFCLWLLEQLEAPAPGKRTVDIDNLVKEYRSQIRKFSAAREAESVLKQFRFLLKVLPERVEGARKGLKKLVAALSAPAPDEERSES